MVCSKELTLEHTRTVAESLRRPVTYWDNYPVNDGPMKAELHIGPYTSRSPYLPRGRERNLSQPDEPGRSLKDPARRGRTLPREPRSV